jgi:hypothetical protein
MKNEQTNQQNKSMQQSMPWPDKNTIKKAATPGFTGTENSASDNLMHQSMQWPDNNKKPEPDEANVGNGNSIGNDPATSTEDDEIDNLNKNNAPEIDTPIYDPEKTKRKLPVMNEGEKGE